VSKITILFTKALLLFYYTVIIDCGSLYNRWQF